MSVKISKNELATRMSEDRGAENEQTAGIEELKGQDRGIFSYRRGGLGRRR